jgi:hypothetical protein
LILPQVFCFQSIARSLEIMSPDVLRHVLGHSALVEIPAELHKHLVIAGRICRVIGSDLQRESPLSGVSSANQESRRACYTGSWNEA